MTEQLASPGLINRKPITIKVIGVGTAGVAMLGEMSRTDLAALPLCVVHANSRVLDDSACGEKILLGAKRLRGLGAGGDPELGRVVAEEEIARVKGFCTGNDLIFLVVGLGGGIGTGAAPVIARVARESGALVLALATLPFEFEGSRRKKQALEGLQVLKSAADAVLCLPNQKVIKLLPENESALRAFELTQQLLAQGARGLWQMLTLPSLIHIDFAYLYSLLRGRQSESCFARAQSSGENRAADVLDQLINSPLLDEGRSLAEADSVLVSLVGGPDMTLAEVNCVMEALNARITKPQLLMGAAIDPTHQGKLAATIIVAKHNKQILNFEPEPAEEELDEPRTELSGIDTSFFKTPESIRPASRFVAPAPELAPEKAEELLQKQKGRGRKKAPRFKQEQLPLEIISKGRFEKSHPTIYHGEDLDVPTYIRKGISLN